MNGTGKPLPQVSREAGFTFLEMLMAIALLGLGMLTYGLTSGSVMTANIKSTKKSQAITLAQDKIEFIKDSANFETHLNDSATEFHVDTDGQTGDGPFTRAWSVSAVGNTGSDQYLHRVEVSVSWVNDGPQEVTLTTLVAE